jgi:uncharacterized protein
MKRQQALSILAANRDEIVRQFDVRHLSLFGSTARDDARENSDIDVLVDFAAVPTFARYVGLLAHLEKLLGQKVDLVTSTGIKPRARANIEKDLVRVA